MNCPVDSVQLVMSDRQGIEIDYCPQCRGVWLDRGELDKLIDRASQHERAESGEPEREERGGHEDGHGHGTGRARKRRRGFLGDMFEFGD